MDRFASIAAFAKVAESGGFRAAAERLDMSVAMVSKHVQGLEDQLGVRLFNRTSRRVSLTEIGREYYERCVLILQELHEADAAAGASQSVPRGLLRVYAHQAIAQFITPVITGYLTRYPETSVDLRAGDLMIDLVREGIDVAISPLPQPDSTLVRKHLADVHLVASCAPAYLERHPLPQHPADLVAHNCLRYAYAPTGDEWRFVDTSGNPAPVRVSGNLLTSSFEILRAAALAGTGILLMGLPLVSGLLESGALVRVLPEYHVANIELVALYPHRRHMTAKLRAFLDMLAEDIPRLSTFTELGP